MERQPLDPQNHRLQLRVGLPYTGYHGEYHAPDRFDSRTVIMDYRGHNRGVNIYTPSGMFTECTESYFTAVHGLSNCKFCRITRFNIF